MNEMDGFKPNWWAIIGTMLFLVLIGWLLAAFINPPPAEAMYCPSEEMLEVQTNEVGVTVLCLD